MQIALAQGDPTAKRLKVEAASLSCISQTGCGTKFWLRCLFPFERLIVADRSPTPSCRRFSESGNGPFLRVRPVTSRRDHTSRTKAKEDRYHVRNSNR